MQRKSPIPKLAILCCSALALPLTAQVCSPGTLVGANSGGNQGASGGGAYFDLTVHATITITEMNFRNGDHATGNSGFLEIYMGPTTWVGNATNPALWTLVDTTVVGPLTLNATNTNPGILSPGVLTNGITLAPGNYGIALRSQLNVWNHGYSNAGAPNPVSTPELTLTAGGATGVWMTGSLFQPRIWNGEIVYTCGGTPITVASHEEYGQGCNRYDTSFGQIFPNPFTSLDIAGQTHTLTFANGIYLVSGSATNTYVPPGPGAVALPLAATTDTASVAAALGGALPFPILYPAAHIAGGVGFADDLEVCLSGYITPVDVAGSGTSAAAPGAQPGDETPTLAEMFDTGLERWCPLWQRMGPVYHVVVEVVGADLVITWRPLIAGTNTFQAVFRPGGHVEYRYDTSTVGGGGGNMPAIIGMTQGHGALWNEIDVSVDVLAGFQTHAVDNTPLHITLDARPLLGTNPNYLIEGYDPATTPLGVVVISLTQFDPGLSLAAFGMPGCEQYVTPDAVRTFITGGAPQVSMPFLTGGIPNLPLYNGVRFLAQALTITGDCAGSPCNSLGVIASGGLRMVMGTL